MKVYDVIVVGAGAAGLIAAGQTAVSGVNVILLEKMNQAGRKLLITGKGRCNITNTAGISDFIKHVHPNGRFLKYAFSQFFSKDIVKLLADLGVDTVIERGGRIFPSSNKSSDILQALLKRVEKNQVDVSYRCRVERLLINNNSIHGVEVNCKSKRFDIFAKKVIICTGGNSYPATGSDGDGYKLAKSAGHEIIPIRPSLVPLVTEGHMAEKLQGLSLRNVKAILWINNKKRKEEFGELLFTHFGLSGPIILTMSRLVVDELRENNQVEITIDLKPALDEQKLDIRLLRDLNEHGKKHIDNIFKMWLPSKLIPVFISNLRIDPLKKGNQLSGNERKKIRLMMKNLRFKVSGHRSFKEAIITAGGVSTNEINSKTMESKLINNLYFAGEIIDCDADTGGYNLQIAYSTAWLAAQSCLPDITQKKNNE